MLLIPLVETIVGGRMSLWPRVILQFLFEFPQSDYSALSLAFFFYGNGLRCSMALRLVSVCHCGPSYELLQRIQSSYAEWSRSPNVTHLCWGHTERYVMYALYAMFATFFTPSGHIGCDSYETRHLHKMMAAGRLPWESDDSVNKQCIKMFGSNVIPSSCEFNLHKSCNYTLLSCS